MLRAKKKLWSPFSKRLLPTRTISSTTCGFLQNQQQHLSNSQRHSSFPFFSYNNNKIQTSSSSGFSSRFLFFSGKSFCSAQSSEKTNLRCWNCNAEPQNAPFLVCESCTTIQPVDHSVDYFQIFGLENKYEMEEDHNLEVKYKNWQKKLHPDLVHSKPEKEREFAAEQSARVIDAYRTLNNALSRAIYILKLEGVNVNEEETVSEPELLAEIMEIREAVEEAPDYQALKEIQSLVQEKLQNWSDYFASALRGHKFEEAKNCIRRMTYYDRVNEEIVKRL
ncbi:PREDICTED: iron-sulfur cluster co-chaperone protein HscB, mitochondrial [Populus euphratica]|uniref:Iron-sulfur cluster co-chaperone protein HscB, mitochondrial n=1 Tax=Populus euphratica TaxID=75702 RepID=A0AAJ6VDK5_POPEU|nr:PREDICTED: iron-sulfur cluster co-chaperone protein HscB, mitochondrial [Populus euphratica]XP_011046447.1 PREDICTED: iron-sulfur cluster co-chaperone protein HscB, mitochondrial [Populus euphratica]